MRSVEPAAETARVWANKIAGRAHREPMFRDAVLVLRDGGRFQVSLKNMSDTGARVEFFSRFDLPPDLMFCVATMNIKRPAQVVWQRDGAAGLKFL